MALTVYSTHMSLAMEEFRRHRLRCKVIVAVGAVEEGFPPLAVHKVGLKDQARTRTRHGIQGTPSWWRAIVHVKATEKER